MHVRETPLKKVLEGSDRYWIPLYQRPYQWSQSNYKQLWDDITELARHRKLNSGATHFTGSLVLAVSSAAPGESTFLVVDGQQRLTTLSALLVALRDSWRSKGDSRAESFIHETYLTDRFAEGDARLKLLPTQADRPAFRAIVDGLRSEDPDSLVDDAHRYFVARLAELDSDLSVAAIQETILDGLVFVTITTDHDDNVFRIFESLNNRGLELTQGDLIRNLVFMKLGADGEAVYNSTWLALQRGVSAKDLEELFWIDLAWSDFTARQADTYEDHKRRIDRMTRSEVVDFVERAEIMARSMRVLRDPQREPDARVRELLEHFKLWDSSVTDPLILRILHLRQIAQIDSEQVASSLLVLESYLVRRFIVGLTGSGLNRILGQASSELDPTDNVSTWLRQYLSSGKRRFATDEQVAKAIRERPAYASGKAHHRRAVLAWLLELHPSRERAVLDGLTIEHVLPQTMTDEWRHDFSKSIEGELDVEVAYEEVLHTLGNLTLTGYNPELSNRPFREKRELLHASSVPDNQDIAALESWGDPEIKARAAVLAERVARHWPGPVGGVNDETGGTDWTIAERTISSIPLGHWAAYSDVALIAETHPIALGQRLARHFVPGGWRVLKWNGRVGSNFQWTADSPHFGSDPIAVLEDEGLHFDARGVADPAKRLGVTRLLTLAGLDATESDEE